MPDDIDNIITISGPKESVDRVKNRILVTEEYIEFVKKRNEGLDQHFHIRVPYLGGLTFNRLIPTPTNIYHGSLSDDEEKKYGEENCWFYWNVNNWGTKWDAYDVYTEPSPPGVFKIYFHTAWDPPIFYLEKLAEVCIEEGCDMNGVFEEITIQGKCFIDGDNKFCIDWCAFEDYVYLARHIYFNPIFSKKFVRALEKEMGKQKYVTNSCLDEIKIPYKRKNIWLCVRRLLKE